MMLSHIGVVADDGGGMAAGWRRWVDDVRTGVAGAVANHL